MYKAKIKLVCRQVIDSDSQSGFEKAIHHASYEEFLLKSQAYNQEGKFKTFTKMKLNDGRANSLHYKLSFAVGHFIEKLDNKIPQIKDNLGSNLEFQTARFELIESHVEDMTLHKVAINYETIDLFLLEVMGEYLLLANEVGNDDPAETFVIRMQPDLSIMTYEVVNHLQIA